MGAVRRTGVDIDKTMTELREPSIEIAPSFFVLRRREVLSPWIESRDDSERLTKAGHPQSGQLTFRGHLTQIDFERGLERKA